MSYVDRSLMPGEAVIARAYIHWWVYARAFLMLLLAAVLAIAGAVLMNQSLHRFGSGEILSEAHMLFAQALLYLIIAALTFIRIWLSAVSAELAVTSVRVIVKTGLIRRSSVDLMNRNVESLSVRQSILGRILNFGLIRIHGTGGIWMPSPLVANPLEFRRQALSAIEHKRGTPY
jgi:uncharacterized membrane protein YdbT with pleckstrin-like domain